MRLWPIMVLLLATSHLVEPCALGAEPLAGRSIDNVSAFARLYGYVRYFYPGDEVAAASARQWETFVADGVRAVQPAESPGELAASLQALFAPVAPALQVWVDGEAEPAVQTLPPDADWTAWVHVGLGTDESPGHVYASTRRQMQDSSSAPFTTLVTALDVSKLQGRSIRLRGRARTDGVAGSDAGLWLRTQRPGGLGFYVEPEMLPDPGTEWTQLEAEGTIDADAVQVLVGVQYIGTGTAWFEPPSLEVVEEGNTRPIHLTDWTPRPDGLPPGWHAMRGRGEFDIAMRADSAGSPVFAEIHHQDAPPEPPFEATLPGNVHVRVPLVLERIGGKTNPVGNVLPPERTLDVADQETRLAAVVIAWNAIQHFFPYFDVVSTDWNPVLREGLIAADQDRAVESLGGTLKGMVAALHDGHGNVSWPQERRRAALPFAWEIVEGQVVITHVADVCHCDLRRGDVVLRFDGVPVSAALAATESTVSAATPQFLVTRALRELRSGPRWSQVLVGVRSSDGEHDVELTRMVFGEAIGMLEEARPPSGSEVAPGVRYVNLDQCTESTWEAILPDLLQARAVIYDMRGYPAMNLGNTLRHITPTPLESAWWEVPTPKRPDREGMDFLISNWTLEPADPRIPGAAVFLTDGRAVSAAETYMGIVEHYRLGPIVGGPTAGTNGNVDALALPGGYRMSWTGMRVLKHDKSQHHGVGIQPTVPVSRTLAGVLAGRDEVLERGIQVAEHEAARGDAHRTDHSPQPEKSDR